MRPIGPEWLARESRVGTALLVVATLLAVLLGEVLVRVVVRRDEDGQEWMYGRRLRPHRLPLHEIERTLVVLQAGTSFLAYDPELGWAPRPGARSADGTWRVDAGGIRTDRDVAVDHPPSELRVALFGDSFTFGDEVGQDQTWGAALERSLGARGVPSEVLNFGVNAYGMDQAFLRWRVHGRRYRPDVVIFGFHGEDVLRNVNVYRPLYFAGSEVPLSKPRFVERDGALALVNVPTIPPARLPGILAGREDDPLVAFERFGTRFAWRWWLHARTAALLVAAFDFTDPWHVDDETRRLARRIVAAFAADVARDGAAFLIVDLPRREDLVAQRRGGALWYDDVLEDLVLHHRVIRPLAAGADDPSGFAPHGHYGPALNAAIGARLVDPVLEAWRTPCGEHAAVGAAVSGP